MIYSPPIDQGVPVPSLLAFYTDQSVASAPGEHASLFDQLPSEPAGVARIVQGLLMYEWVAEPFYAVSIPNQRREETHLRTVEELVAAMLTLDDRALTEQRSPEHRVVGICRHFMLLAVAILRHHGTPARSRGGFGDYFVAGKYEDHWVCEYWDHVGQQWKLLDPQFDEKFIEALGIEHDITDVPRDKFWTAAAAWRACRSGEADPMDFGIQTHRMRGLWFVAGSLLRDLATVNNVEVLPWDVWGEQPPPDTDLTPEALTFFDGIAELTADPDAQHAQIRSRFTTDPRLTVPATVFNSLLQRRDRIPQT